MGQAVPVIDLSEDPGPVARKVDEAFREIGFMAIVGHEVPPEALEAAWQAAVEFFELGDEVKSRFVDPNGPYGYPPLDAVPEPGQIRAGSHSDYGSLTILKPGEARGGLEVRTRDGEWAAVPVIEDAFVVNIGDVMERWTNDRWVSTLHRVVVPPDEVAATEERYSMAWFQNPAADALVEVVPTTVPNGEAARYEPVVFGEWLKAKVEAATG